MNAVNDAPAKNSIRAPRERVTFIGANGISLAAPDRTPSRSPSTPPLPGTRPPRSGSMRTYLTLIPARLLIAVVRRGALRCDRYVGAIADREAGCWISPRHNDRLA